MKTQYLGDVRDLFKYDLIQRILKEVSSLQGFTFISMLTKNDPKSGEGNKRDFDKAKAGTNNKDLMKSLKRYNKIDPNERDFTEVEKHFKSKGVKITIYKENEFFERKSREDYFKKIEKRLLSNSLIFVDPDIGLQIKNSTKKHLLYSEVKELYERMDEYSILMIFQYFPREDHTEYLSRRANELRELTEDLPIYISDNEIIFFLLTKNRKLKSKLEGIINEYKRGYQTLR